MKVLHVYKDYHPVVGGIENHMRDLAREQAARGHEVTVLVTHDSRRDEESWDGAVRVLRTARWATVASTPLSTALPARLARLDRDVTHLHFPYPVGELANLAFGRGRPVVVTYHGDIVRQSGLLKFYDPFLHATLRRADRILATSPAYVTSSAYLRKYAAKTRVVPLGIAHERFVEADPAAVAALRARLAPAGETLFLSVGRMRYYKGLDGAVRALSLVRDHPIRLVLVGDGPMLASLRSQVAELGLEHRVEFAGPVGDEDLPLWFHAADVYLSSASHRSEAFGISIVEAMAAARPAITTELGTGTSFVNQHGVTGLVVPANDAEALAAAMRSLAGDADRRSVMGTAARERVEREFTLGTMATRVLAIYDEVVRERSRG